MSNIQIHPVGTCPLELFANDKANHETLRQQIGKVFVVSDLRFQPGEPTTVTLLPDNGTRQIRDKTDVKKTETNDPIAVYRKAGEFYGVLHKELKFGELTMRQQDCYFVFQWSVTKDLCRYGANYSVDFLQSKYGLQNLALDVAREWKHELQNAVKEGKF